MKEKKELLYNEWIDYLQHTRERSNYSIRRFDLLIISISSGGIYVVFETIKEINSNHLNTEHPKLLFISGICFLVAIISNFISQMTGFSANNNEEKFIISQLKQIKNKKTTNSDSIEPLEKKIDRYNYWTKGLNYVSMISMLIGLLISIIFNYLLF